MNRITIVKIIVIFLILFGYAKIASATDAVTNPEWAQPTTIPGLIDSGYDPVVIADSEGTIHIFNSQPVGETRSIFYTRWTFQKEWSALADIIKSPQGGDARVQSCYIDKNGWIHLIFWGGDDLGANIYYTKAPLINANKSTAWSDPSLIGKSAIAPSTATLVVDEQGHLIVLYSGDLSDNGFYSVQSLDDGDSWSAPEPVFLTNSNSLYPSALSSYIDSDGSAYAVWGLGDDTGLSQAVYFSRWENKEQRWSRPLRIAEAIEHEADTPSIIKYDEQLFLIYHNNFPTTRWMQRSSNNGDTWTDPVRLFEQVGSNGAAALVVDSVNGLHMFFGNRIDATSIHGAWHSQWLGEQWSKPNAIVSGPQIQVGPNGEEGFDPSNLQATTSRGNLAFVLWRHDPQAGPINLWYSYRMINGPQLPITPLPSVNLETLTVTAQPTETPITTQAPKASPVNVQNISPIPSGNDNNVSGTLLLSILPIILLVFFIIVVQRRGK